MSEGVGTTALPTSSAGSPVRVYLDTGLLMQSAAQPQASSLANYDAAAYEDTINGKRIDINQHLIVYVVKNGLIRVLHRHTPMKTLLRAHKDQRVSDMQFFQDGDVLATVGGPPPELRGGGSPSTVVIWRVFERSPEISSETLLEIRTTLFAITRVVWHPFNPNQFWMIHSNEKGRMVATLVDTTKITTQRHPTAVHPVCECADFLITPNAIQVKSSEGDLTDLAWNTRDARHVLTTHTSGEIILWDTTQLTPDRTNASLQPKRIVTVKEEFAVTRALFLPHEHLAATSLTQAISSTDCLTTCFVTGSCNNSVLTLWSPFCTDGSEPQRAQTIELQEPPSSCLIDVVFGQAPPNAAPPSSFVVVSDRTAGNIWAFHCRSSWDESGPQKRPLLVGADYVVPFKTLYPTYSWTVVGSPTTDITEEELQEQGGLIFDTKIFAYQSKHVQCLTLTSYMCLPPESTWTDPTPGVRVQRIFPVHSAHVSEIGSDTGDNALQYDEEYDIGDDEDGDIDEEEYEAPDPSTLPPPGGVVSNGAPPGLLTGNLNAGNPFSNWLGAFVGQAPVATTPQQPEAPPASSLPKPPTSTSPAGLLSPAELTTLPPAAPETASKAKKSSSRSKSRDGSTKKGPPNKPPAEGIKILKREEPPKEQSPKLPQPTPVPPVPVPVPVPDVAPSAVQGGEDIRQVIREEIHSLVPEIARSVQEALKPALLDTVQRSIQDSSKPVGGEAVVSGVVGAIDEPLRQAFTHNMKAILVPSIEAITGQILKQVSSGMEKFETGMKSSGNKEEIQALSAQVATLTGLVEKLSTEVNSLRSSLSQPQQQRQAAVAATPPAPNDAEVLKREINGLLQEKKFEAAFTKAVSASTTEMTVFCCANADISEVLGADQIRLSQPILICLMQQLGTVVGSSKEADLKIELEWLQDIALSLDPKDKRIHMHVPGVLEQLDVHINTRLSKADASLKRPLMRLLSIIRGIRQ